jgi:hypothetical protein
MHVKVYGFMIRGFIGEAETMDTSLLNYEIKLITSLVTRIVDLSSTRIFNLLLVKMEQKLSCMAYNNFMSTSIMKCIMWSSSHFHSPAE